MSFAAVKLILTLKCEQSTRLVSQSLDGQLGWSERWAVRLHALCCRPCRRYKRQILFLRQALRRGGQSLVEAMLPDQSSLSPQARERIRQALTRQDSA